MKKTGFAALVASGLAAGLIGLAAPVQAAPNQSGNAQDVITDLQSQGYNVIVNRFGSGPLSEAQVIAVRPGTTYERFDYGVAGADHPVKTVVNRTVYVDVK
ncbi:hypothetical protein [Mycolicibacterium thermoresistibile]|mgnify:FL=1|jgi:hypothetical protein|uniref:Uncharacterized protein n=1 Tax=Mycolicibacterium thermoresistibile TaxID=1797 RepID=A0A100XB81_MYCTH|nr:hypothetical protein [Mycolicibacterium thermoresistibile]MCV7188350.1 hypothetical protein [Mycolicibacterium thermoresistibile]GAT13432.1 putative uncharacterized protein [Mycolicibacterium thermoresistibile]SNW18394.1 Uncharacterised protein [Mycolicibacterium thermoresistibile]